MVYALPRLIRCRCRIQLAALPTIARERTRLEAWQGGVADGATGSSRGVGFGVAQPQVGQHFQIKKAAVVDAVVVVLAPEEEIEPALRGRVPTVVDIAGVEPLPNHQRLQLDRQLGRDRDQVRRIARKVRQPVKRVATLELPDRLWMIIDRYHHVAVVQRAVATVPTKHQQRSRLLPPYVSTRSLPSLERGHQPFGQDFDRLLEGLDHPLRDLAAGQPVTQRDAVPAHGATGPSLQSWPGVGSSGALVIKERELPLAAVAVAGGQDLPRLLRRRPAPQQRQPERTVSRVPERLRGHHTDLRVPVRDEAPDPRELRLHGHTKITAGTVAAKNRKGHPYPPVAGSHAWQQY